MTALEVKVLKEYYHRIINSTFDFSSLNSLQTASNEQIQETLMEIFKKISRYQEKPKLDVSLTIPFNMIYGPGNEGIYLPVRDAIILKEDDAKIDLLLKGVHEIGEREFLKRPNLYLKSLGFELNLNDVVKNKERVHVQTHTWALGIQTLFSEKAYLETGNRDFIIQNDYLLGSTTYESHSLIDVYLKNKTKPLSELLDF